MSLESKKEKSLIIAPRTHPNLRYFARDFPGEMPDLLVSRCSKDFVAPDGMDIYCFCCGNHPEILSRRYSTQVFRFYERDLQDLASRVRTTNCLQIQYDQWPASQGKYVFLGLLYLAYRKFRGRPLNRITPNYKVEKNFSYMEMMKERIFSHPSSNPDFSEEPPFGKVKLGTVGKRYYPDKRIDLLISSLRKINFRGSLSICSSDHTWTNRPSPSARELEYDARIQKLAKGADFQISVLHNLTQVEMLKWYSELSLFVLPSINEAFSTSQLEALSRGVPSIITSDNGATCTIREGKTGHVISKSRRALEKILKEVAMDSSKLTALRAKTIEEARKGVPGSLSLEEAIGFFNRGNKI